MHALYLVSFEFMLLVVWINCECEVVIAWIWWGDYVHNKGMSKLSYLQYVGLFVEVMQVVNNWVSWNSLLKGRYQLRIV